MTDLSRERIAELRASRKPLTWGELLALLDAYEAQRPRPASEPPDTNRPVCGWYWHPSAGWDVRAVARHNGEWWEQHLCGLESPPVYWSEWNSQLVPPAPERDDG